MDQMKKPTEICLVFPPKVTSPGLPALLLGKHGYGNLLDYSAPRLQLQMIVIFVLTQILHSLLKNLGLPLFISQILVIAALIHMKAMYIGILTVIVPIISCLITIAIRQGGGDLILNRSFFLATRCAGTSFPVIHYLLTELGILNSELGRLGLLVALIGDMVTLVLTMIGMRLKIWILNGTKQVLVDIGWAMLFIVIAAFVLRPAMKWMVKQTKETGRIKDELRMIGCIHVPGNVNSIISLLHACCPTRQSSIALDVLHLVKLSGRATPVIITHDKPTETMLNQPYSENVIVAFNRFQRNTWEAVSVKAFTAVSPPNLMYEDIWIHLDVRRNLKSFKVNSSSYNIAVIFMGGQDDREALALAKRISQDESVSLTVIHLKARNSLEETFRAENDRMLDDELLSDIKRSVKLTYIEEQENDGTETSHFLRSIVQDYQLIIVGRRYKCEDPQTLGLGEWCEFQEIGIIGDLLSSSDFVGNYFSLIVQQRQQRSA
ncbi:putative Cation/H+ exchanger 4 [Hibiscus syriacus]|uniref:Cation/H+ exchanger 4 n=1 Tax=Hibiscus syriacus TaxID=106335 RepID=A0A6A3C7B4_HIBSY|nr:putative Cation/H+ exchanger 4 [Hibiscus syriacus]